MSPNLSDFLMGLSYMSLSLGPDAKSLCVQIHIDDWNRLYYEACKRESQSPTIGIRYPPPKGKSWANGMWLQGHWVEGV